MAGPAGNLLSGSHARRASEGSLTGLERRAEIAFQRDRDREGGGVAQQLACESPTFNVATVQGACFSSSPIHILLIITVRTYATAGIVHMFAGTLSTTPCSCRFQSAAKDVASDVCGPGSARRHRPVHGALDQVHFADCVQPTMELTAKLDSPLLSCRNCLRRAMLEVSSQLVQMLKRWQAETSQRPMCRRSQLRRWVCSAATGADAA